MGYMQLGVGVPIKNRSFKFGTYGEDQLATAYANGLTLNVNSDQRNLFGEDDYVVVGPSNNASHIGKSETVKISSVGTNSIVLDSSLTYNYAASDYVSGVGNRVAAGWTPQVGYGSGMLCKGFDVDGHRHNSAQFIQVSATPASAGVPEDYTLRQTLTADNLMAFNPYRMGFYYKFTLNTLDPTLRCTVNDGVGAFINRVLVANNNVTSYTLFTKLAYTYPGVGSGNMIIDIIIRLDGLAEPTAGTAYIDQMFLEHAKGTSGFSSGVYTFTEYPEFGSIQWQRSDSFKRIQLRNLATKIYDSSGTSGKQYFHKISMQFDNVSEDFYESLITLMNYQLDGNFLILHQDSVPKITPTLYGIMSITGLRHNMFDLTKISFTLTFEEVA